VNPGGTAIGNIAPDVIIRSGFFLVNIYEI